MRAFRVLLPTQGLCELTKTRLLRAAFAVPLVAVAAEWVLQARNPPRLTLV